ncbi:hypothetical protein H5410_001360, partial [Solanum commersonii]
RKEATDEAWRNTVLKPCQDIVEKFLKNDDHNITKMNTFINNNNKFNKMKVVFIMGAIGTGKSRLSVDLVTHFRGEIINSDKMQVYKGLEIVTNKITHVDKQGVRHYLLGKIEPDSNFTAEDFYLKSTVYIKIYLKTQCVPMIVGGSNLYIENLWRPIHSVLNCRVDTGLMKWSMRSFCSYFIYESKYYNDSNYFSYIVFLIFWFSNICSK